MARRWSDPETGLELDLAMEAIHRPHKGGAVADRLGLGKHLQAGGVDPP
jgi:hypothetical protein